MDEKRVMKFSHAFIFDIDGVLANLEHRLHFIQGDKKDWDNFYKDMDKDSPIQANIDMIYYLHRFGEILFVTGRSEKYRKQTVDWLANNLGYGDPESQKANISKNLYMRKDGDYRPDYIIKEEIYKNKIEPCYKVQAVFEDRKTVVDMWRKLGLACYQPCDGNY